MNIYHNILKGKVLFPKNFNSKAQSLVKHLLQADLSKRYGNLLNGVKDIQNHRFFKEVDWNKVTSFRNEPSYKPSVKGADDSSLFQTYEESTRKIIPLKPSEDPFLLF